MQKKIIALAIAAAFAAPVAAMADATVYGVVDGGLRSITTNGTTSNVMSSYYGLNSSRFGIKSSEDLGDGLKANVVLEGDLFVATGQNSSAGTGALSLFSRQSTVGLSGSWGAIDLGRQYTTAFKVNTVIDPFGHQFIGVTSANVASGFKNSTTSTLPFGAAAITRNDSDIAYTGKFGDVTVMANKSVGVATSDSGATAAIGATYVSGPITVAGEYTKVKAGVSTALVTSDMTHWQLGAGFNFGDGSVKVGYADQKNADSSTTLGSLAGSDAEAKNVWIGGNYNLSSKVGVTAAYYRTTYAYTGSNDVVGTNVVAAVTYALSKKTALYVEADKQTLDNASDTTAYSLGMNVAF